MKFFRKKNTQAKEERAGLNTDFVRSIDFSTSFEDVLGNEEPEETIIYNLDGTVAEVQSRNEQRK